MEPCKHNSDLRFATIMNSATTNRKVDELEAELQALKVSSTQALEQSWKEVERLRNQLDERRRCSSNWSGSFVGDKPSLEPILVSSSSGLFGLNVIDSTDRTTSDDVSILSIQDKAERTDVSLRSTTTLSETLGSFLWTQHRAGHRQIRIEQDLMRQLEFLQEHSARCMHEMEIKLSQRESAIETLEIALRIKDATVRALRDELDDLKAKSERPRQYSSYAEGRERNEKGKGEISSNDSCRSLCKMLLDGDRRQVSINENDALGVRLPSRRGTFGTQPRVSASKSPSRRNGSRRSASPFKTRSPPTSRFEN